MRIMCVSDISIGYGSPQIPFLIDSLKGFYGTTEATIIETDQPERPPQHHLYPDIQIIRVPTSIHPHTQLGRIEYVIAASKIVNRYQPDVLIIPNTYSLPVLLKLKRRPRKVIYYVLEVISPFGYSPFEYRLNRRAGQWVDLALYPEENRAAMHIDECGYHHIPNIVLYNVLPLRQQPIVPPAQRNGKILYQGTISAERTFATYYTEDAMRGVPIDLYGVIEGATQQEKDSLVAQLVDSIRYCGYLDSDSLAAVRQNYCHSIVIWNPENQNQLYACPNKFFESITDGVPPITAPHPQTKTLVNRYKCGIVMEDWSFEAFRAAIKKAMNLPGTSAYDQMVANCQKAARAELNWETQFKKVLKYL